MTEKIESKTYKTEKIESKTYKIERDLLWFLGVIVSDDFFEKSPKLE